MAIAFVRQTTAECWNVTSKAITITAPTAGDCLVVTIATAHAAGTTDSVTGGGVTTWAALSTSVFTNYHVTIWWGIVDTTPTTTVTVGWTDAKSAAFNLSEWSGIKATGAADTTNTAAATSTTKGGGSVTPSAVPALVISCALHIDGNSPSAGPTGGFTALTEAKRTVPSTSIVNNSSYLIQTGSPAAADPTWTIGSQAWEGVTGVLLGTQNTLSDPMGMSGFFGG